MPIIPSGTVTFLFTDIEGSTKLWEYYPAAMQISLAQHDAILRQAIEAHEGYVFKTVGDAFCAAFSTAKEALLAALEIQYKLAQVSWNETGALRVRMALHTGTTEERDSDYFGATVNRVARLLSAGYGGQILLSLATEELVRDHLPIDISLHDMGERRLKDLIRPEHVFQVDAPDLPHDFPPLKTLDNLPNNLPIQLTSFIGREKEINEVRQLLLEGTKLVTLFGTGGAGKTRLSLQVAAELLNGYEDGVWFVELAPVTDGKLVAQAVANSLDVREIAGRSALNVLVEYLRPKNLLLVLDNCEHVVEDSARLADAILRQCPKVQILASSREALGVPGELTWQIPSMSLPQREDLPPIETLTQYEAVRLFLERALAVEPTFQITNKNAAALAQICYQLDGIPLAIELAAARVKVLSVEQIAERLQDRFRLLTGGSRTLLPRQQTLRALVEWSYNLLTPAEQTMWQRLTVFNSSWSLEAAEEICSVGDEIESYEVLDLLTQLVNKSLVIAEEQNLTAPSADLPKVRYRMLETIRQYGLEKLKLSPDYKAIQDAHLSHFKKFVNHASSRLQSKAQVTMLIRLDNEFENLRTAFDYAVAEEHWAEATEISTSIWFYWFLRGNLLESRRWVELLIQHRELLPPNLRARLLVRSSLVVWRQGDFELGRQLVEEGVALAREVNDIGIVANGLLIKTVVASATSNIDEAERMAQEAYDLTVKAGDRWALGQALNNLAEIVQAKGDFKRALGLLEKSLEVFRESGDNWGISSMMSSMAFIYYNEENFEQSAHLFEESLAQYQQIFGQRGDSSHALSSLGLVRVQQGLYEEARQLFEKSLKIRRRTNDVWGNAHVNVAMANSYRLQKNYTQAHEHLNLAEELFSQLDNREGLLTLYLAQGNLVLAEGRLEEATKLFRKALEITQALNYKDPLPLSGLAEVAWKQGDAAKAGRLAAAARQVISLSILETHNRVQFRRNLADIPESPADSEVVLAEVIAEELAN